MAASESRPAFFLRFTHPHLPLCLTAFLAFRQQEIRGFDSVASDGIFPGARRFNITARPSLDGEVHCAASPGAMTHSARISNGPSSFEREETRLGLSSPSWMQSAAGLSDGTATETLSTANSKAVNSRTLRSPVIHRSCRRCWPFPATNLPIASSFPVATIIVLVAELPP